MRLLAVALLAAFIAAPVSAADKNEDKAKSAALSFLKAVKKKDVDAVMKLSAAPFAHREGSGDISVIKDEKALKKWIKERLDDLKDADKVPTEIEKIAPFSELKEKIPEESEQKKLEDVIGKDGLVATFSLDGQTMVMLVRIKDGKAKIVGVGH